jgi:UDP-glucose 4-epimerase
MNILITGGTGYVGSIIGKYLQEQGHHIVVLDNMYNGNTGSTTAKIYQADLKDIPKVVEALKKEKIDAVIHCAGVIVVSESVTDPYKYFLENTQVANCLTEAMHQAGVKYCIFSSTSEVYGHTPSLPITEDMPKLALNPYGLSKWMAEQIFEWADRAYGIKTVSHRYMNAAGGYPDGSLGEYHRPETHLIPSVINSVLGRGEFHLTFEKNDETPDHSPIRDYVHPYDIARAAEMSLKYLQEKNTSNAFNLGNGVGYSVLEIVDQIEKLFKTKIERTYAQTRSGEPAMKYCSYDKIKKELGWEPKYDIKGILETSYEFQKKHPDGYTQ